MQYYAVEGNIKNADNMKDEIMQEHMAYTQEVMDAGEMLLSSLKSDMSGAYFIMKVRSQEELENYLYHEPFYLHGIQTYTFHEIDVHYVYPMIKEWFAN